MLIRFNRIGDVKQETVEVNNDFVRLGASPQNNVVLSSPYVPSLVAVIARSRAGWEFTAKSEAQISVGGHAVNVGEKTLLLRDVRVEIYPFEIFLDDLEDVKKTGLDRSALDDLLSDLLVRVHQRVIAQIDIEGDSFKPNDPEFLKAQEANIDEFASLEGIDKSSNSNVLLHAAGHTILSELLAKVLDSTNANEKWKIDALWTKQFSKVEQLERELKETVQWFHKKFKVSEIKDESDRVEVIEKGFWGVWQDKSSQIYPQLLKYLSERYIKKQIKDLMFGYGPLEDLLRLPSVSEIMVVSRDKIYVEKYGVLEKTGRRFVSDEVTRSIIARIVGKVNRRIDNTDPLVDARLEDGSRVNAVIPPIAINGPCITIRKFPDKRLQMQDLIKKNALSATADRFLRACVEYGANVLVSGGTGSGKTTLLNCLSDYIPDKARIVTIEDTAELQLAKEHVVSLETKPPNVENQGEYDIRSLVKNALRMRPDRIVVGECRGAEALDMLQAMNTGHDGSMTTIHANTSEDSILRLEVLVQQAGEMPIATIHRQIASAIDIVVQLSRFSNGRRCVTQITEFVDFDESTEEIVVKDIFRLGRGGYDAPLVSTGSLPSFMNRLIEKDLLDLELFYSQ